MKLELRKEALEKRKSLNHIELSEIIVQNIKNSREYQKSKNIINYYPLKYEVDTKNLLNDKNKTWYLPRVNGENLEICLNKNLKKGSFGIIEPQCECIKDYSSIDMIIIPACAADIDGYRLGYGKGYYDRFLPKLPITCQKVVVIYSELLYKTICPENFDIKVDMVITDKEILRI